MKNMKEINLSDWQNFPFSKVFSFERGERLITLDQTDGDIAYVSSSKINNGIDNYINPPEKMKIFENALTLNNSGSVGYCFYHPYKFVCSDHCTVVSIIGKKMTPLIAVFLKPIIESIKEKYSFAREISNYRLSKEIIKLPVNTIGNPDWEYMENYIKEKSLSVMFSSEEKLKKFDPIKPENLVEFDITKLFNLRGAKKSFTKHEIDPGEYLYVTTSNKNNGVFSTSNIYTENGGVITLDSATDGKAFYQENKFVGSDHVEVLEPIGFKLNKSIAMYLVTILNFQLSRYGYGRKRAQKRIKMEKLYLPYVKNEKELTPDWNLIEKYIQSLPYSSNL